MEEAQLRGRPMQGVDDFTAAANAPQAAYPPTPDHVGSPNLDLELMSHILHVELDQTMMRELDSIIAAALPCASAPTTAAVAPDTMAHQK